MVQAVSGYSAGYYEKEEDHTLRNILLTTAVAALACYGAGKYNLNKNTSIFDNVKAENMKKIGLFDDAAEAAKKIGKNADDVKELNFFGRFANMVDSWFDWGNYAKKAQAPKNNAPSPSAAPAAKKGKAKNPANQHAQKPVAPQQPAPELDEVSKYQAALKTQQTQINEEAQKIDDEIAALTKKQATLNTEGKKTGDEVWDKTQKALNEANAKKTALTAQQQSINIAAKRQELDKARAELDDLYIKAVTSKNADDVKKYNEALAKYKTEHTAYAAMKDSQTDVKWKTLNQQQLGQVEEAIVRKIQAGKTLSPQEIAFINASHNEKSVFANVAYRDGKVVTETFGGTNTKAIHKAGTVDELDITNLPTGTISRSEFDKAALATVAGNSYREKVKEAPHLLRATHTGGDSSIQAVSTRFNDTYTGYQTQIRDGRIWLQGGETYKEGQFVDMATLNALETNLRADFSTYRLPSGYNFLTLTAA